ncbi:MAG: exodeoxyribonuclease VII large subunit [Acetivibrionales bacterium]|jgi:exodeoxyribonuclease VII large subunit
MDRTLTVTELTRYIKQLVDSDMLLSNVWITGEISNFKLHTSGHMYFSLKDKGALIKCVMFRTQNNRLKFRPEEGMSVIARGYVSVYPQGGAYQLYVDDMQPDGTGALYMAFEQLKSKLETQGLFDASRKKKIPLLPKAVGVITSPTGAVIRDMIQILDRRYPNTRIVVYGAAVQGIEAPAQLIEGIRYFNEKRNVEVIILARGGGSLEDLWPFNDEGLAIAISKSGIPIISAVGHETDFSISDFAADLRAPTPSAAAELVMPEKKALKDTLESVEKRLFNCLTYGLKKERDRISRLQSVRSLQKPFEIVNQKRLVLDAHERSLILQGRAGLERTRISLKTVVAQLNALSPLTVLARGYGVIQDENGKLIKSVKGLKSGDKLVVTMTDGKFQAVCDKML